MFRMADKILFLNAIFSVHDEDALEVCVYAPSRGL